MGFVFRLEDYSAYEGRVGDATVVDVTRRTDPARIERVWDHLRAVFERYGAPWVVQLWTKDLEGCLTRGGDLLAELRGAGTTLTAQVTVTGLFGTVWEPCNTATPFAGAEAFGKLAGGPAHITWRYDPIIPTVHKKERFFQLTQTAADLGITRAVVNFVVPPGRYKRVDRRMPDVLSPWSDGMPGYDDAWRLDALDSLRPIAQDAGIRLAVCAESNALHAALPGIAPAACGDRDWFVALSGRSPEAGTGKGSRPDCGCAPYFDVGLYGQWRRCHQCVYCYAG